MTLEIQKKRTSEWFAEIRDKICHEFEKIENEFSETKNQISPGKFQRKEWKRESENEKDKMLDLGGGEMSFLKNGLVFESVAVNISTVFGEFSEKLLSEIKKSQEEFSPNQNAKIQKSEQSNEARKFFATGISLIAHMQNPHVPAVHFNTRFIANGEGDCLKSWFGGGYDLTPLYENQEDYDFFHQKTKECCDRHNPSYHPKFKKQCDEYFYLPHRKEARGIGGIFYDYLNTENFEKDLDFTRDVGLSFLEIYLAIVRKNMNKSFDHLDREKLFLKRGRYVEFNLLYDRGTRFGLLTSGNTNSILSSLPPIAKWNNEGF
jgi:coproporphyrinogen III oxidase